MTLVAERTVIRDWVAAPRAGHGIHVADDADGWTRYDYPEIAGRAMRVAAALHAQGVAPGDRVCVLMPSGIDYIAAIYAVWVAGAAVTPVPPPVFEDRDQYLDRAASIITQTRCRLTVTTPELLDLTQAAHERAGQGTAWLYEEAADELAPVPAPELALVQFTSGSTGTPRGVMISWRNLAANLELVRHFTGWQPGDAASSWLPLHHDLGFVGLLLTTVALQGDLYLMRPDQFIRDPLRWLRSLQHAHHTAAPPFALAYTARRVAAEQADDLDLSGLRSIAIGAETVRPRPLAAFIELATRAGMPSGVCQPGYGLAEATLIVSARRNGEEPAALRVDPASLRMGAPVTVLEQGTLGEHGAARSPGWLIGSGRPAGDTAVQIVGEDRSPVADGVLGEVLVTGPTVALGYAMGDDPDDPVFSGGSLATGDAGFVHDGELFVLGRIGTSVKVRGRSVFVEELDLHVAHATGLSLGQLATVAGERADEPAVALFVEAEPSDWVPAVRAALRTALGPGARIDLVCGDRGLIQRTSSGKPRRRAMWAMLQDGLPAGARIVEDDHA